MAGRTSLNWRVRQKAKITHYEDDFYVFDTGSDKLYCSWDGTKMVTAGMHGISNVAFIMQLPDNDNFMTVSYFADEEAVIELYKRAGYVGQFPGLSMPDDIPGEGTVIESYKLREYTDEGSRDIGVNTMTIDAVDGRMIFYDVWGTDGFLADYIGIYLDSSMFMSMGMNDEGATYEMMQYRDGVFYCFMMVEGNGDIWVTEYGDQSSASYPDKNLEGSIYLGTEEAVIFKDGRIVERISGNGIGLEVLMQDDGCLSIITADQSGDEIAIWTAMFYDQMPLHYYGISVQPSIEYEGVMYHGCYFGYFDSKNCGELKICGALLGEDGSSIVISQTYESNDTA